MKKPSRNIKKLYEKFELKNKLEKVLEIIKKHYVLCGLWLILIISNILIDSNIKYEVIFWALLSQLGLVFITNIRFLCEKPRKIEIYKEIINLENMYTNFEESKFRVFFTKKIYILNNIFKIKKLRVFVGGVWLIDTFGSLSEEVLQSALEEKWGIAMWKLIDNVILILVNYIQHVGSVFENVNILGMLCIIVFFIIISYNLVCILFESIICVLNIQPWTSNYELVLADHAYVKCFVDKAEEKIKESIND